MVDYSHCNAVQGSTIGKIVQLVLLLKIPQFSLKITLFSYLLSIAMLLEICQRICV